MVSDRSRREALAGLVVLTLIWGYNWVTIKLATQDASPLLVASVRCVLGALLLFAFLALSGRSLRPTPWRDTAVYGLLQTTGFTLFQTLAVSLAGAGKVAVLVYTMPFWIALIAWPVLHERIEGAARWIALALAAVGLCFVLWPFDPHAIVGDVFAIVAGLSWGASAVWAKRLRARHDVELLSLTAWQMVWGTIPIVIVALLVPEHVTITTRFIVSMAFITIVAQSGAWALWLFIISRLPVSVAGIASLATPVLGVLFAALQLHEIPSTTELIGIALIVSALVLNSLPLPGARTLAVERRRL